MKKAMIIILCALLPLFSFGCREEEAYVQPLPFYYPIATMNYNVESVIIQSEVREGQNWETADQQLAAYLKGPLSTAFHNPFPPEMTLILATVEENTLHLTFSDHLGTLSGLDLTIACCCIAQTAMALYPVEQVSISAETVLLSGKRVITLNRNNMLLQDSAQ